MKKLFLLPVIGFAILGIHGCNEQNVGGSIRDVGSEFNGTIKFNYSALTAGTGTGSWAYPTYQTADKVFTVTDSAGVTYYLPAMDSNGN